MSDRGRSAFIALVAISIAACVAVDAPVGNALDRPNNMDAIAPILVAQGSGAAGEFRIWAYRTKDGSACIELSTTSGSSSACDPTGQPPVDGSGIGRTARGVIVWADTDEASATSAIVHDESGAQVRVALFDVGPTMPGIKVAVASQGSSANPMSMNFVDDQGSVVSSVQFR